MDTRFPALAQRVYDCESKLRAHGEGLEAHASPLFGTFYNYCINGPREGVVDGVSTGPHVDGKNLALMFCAVFVWGTHLVHMQRSNTNVDRTKVNSTTMKKRGWCSGRPN